MTKCHEPLFRKWQRVVDDWPTDTFIPTAETRICSRDRCREYTWWAAKGQRTRGYCLTCFPGVSFWTVTPEHEIRVIHAFLTAFPGTTVSQT